MLGLVVRNLYLFLLMVVLAFIEVQIEGKDGWASKLPTWKPKGDGVVNKTFKKILSGKELTGYHLATFTFVLLILHLPFFFTFTWRWWRELEVLSLFFLFLVFWDFLWFILNPYYGLEKFKSVEVWWHNQWLGPWPLDYYWGIIASFLVYLPVMFLDKNIFNQWIWTLVTFTIFTVITIIIIKMIKMIKKAL